MNNEDDIFRDNRDDIFRNNHDMTTDSDLKTNQ